MAAARRNRHNRLARSQHQFALDRRLRVEIGGYREFESLVVFESSRPTMTVSAVKPWRTALPRERFFPLPSAALCSKEHYGDGLNLSK